MPAITEPFTYIGTANSAQDGQLISGFPFQSPTIEVGGRDYWSTLGGTNKDNFAGLSSAAKQANIRTSIANAGKLYWMIYAFNAVGFNDAGVSSPVVGLEEVEPYDRQLPVSGTGILIWDSDIVIMTVSGEFVGYGLLNLRPNATAAADYNGFQIGVISPFNNPGATDIALVGLSSYMDDFPALTNEAVDYAYVDIVGISFIAYAYAYDSTGSPTADATSKTASSNGDTVSLVPASGDTLEFYTT